MDIIEQAKSKHNNKNSLFLEKYLTFYSMPVNETIILYESFNGDGMIDNPYGVFKSFEQRRDFNDYTHVWVIKDYDSAWFNIVEYSKYFNVKFVLYGSDDYLFYLSTSKYLINNCTFPPYFTKKPDQVYINTWHGITNKYLGYDVPKSNTDMGNTIRNFLACDYILSANSFMTDIYRKSYKLDGIWCGKYIEAGQPRNDLMFCHSKQYVVEKLKSYGVHIEAGKKIVLYAPTWQGTISKPKHINFKAVAKALGVDGYQVLIKAHHVVYDKDHQHIPVEMDTNELISICDVLVTDYSSIYYDWLMLNRPVIFYAPDYDCYKKKHGLYSDFPCSYAKNLQMLHTMMLHVDDLFKANKHLLIKENEKHNQYKFDSGAAVLNAIIDGDKTYVKEFVSNKTKLLFYAGDFKPNGVTTSFSSLLNTIDYDKYDVSVIALKKTYDWYIDYVNSINPKARVLCRAGTYAQTLLEECANDIVLSKGIGSEYLFDLLPKEMYRREFNRCFGNTCFDKLINFTGYSPFYGYFFMCNPGEKIIWQHNDMVKDQNREENGIKPLYGSLSTVFTTYQYYDKIVSATKEVMALNIKSFPNVDKSKFYYAHNTINYGKVLSMADKENGIDVDESKVNFVNSSRLSYAKNHVNLIRAFHRFHGIYPAAELYLIGDGNLKEEMLKEQNGADYIHITGYNPNPFNTLKKCDCFVFPSLYEGQGLSLIEARMLGLPIIVSPLPKMRGIFIKNGQYELSGFEEDDIFNGLCDYMEDPNKYRYSFKASKYNEAAYKEFEKVVDS